MWKKRYDKKINTKSPRLKAYKSSSCGCGHIHHSRAEAEYCNKLNLLKLAGDITDIKAQIQYELKVNGKKICCIRPDFLVTYKNGKQRVIEVKGFSTEVWALKWKLFEALYPELEKKVEYI